MRPRVALIHAVTLAIDPVQEAFRRLWPDAYCSNLLEDSLGPDREREGELTAGLAARIGTLADYAASTGADGVLFTCSSFGPAIEQAAARLPIPVLKPNEAMFEAAFETGDQIGMLSSFAPAVASMEREFIELARLKGAKNARIRTVCVPGAMHALRAGKGEEHDRLLAEAAAELSGCEAVMLAQFSTARAERAVAATVPCPVLTSPVAAVQKLRRAITGDAP